MIDMVYILHTSSALPSTDVLAVLEVIITLRGIDIISSDFCTGKQSVFTFTLAMIEHCKFHSFVHTHTHVYNALTLSHHMRTHKDKAPELSHAASIHINHTPTTVSIETQIN